MRKWSGFMACAVAAMIVWLIVGIAGANTSRTFMKIGRIFACLEFDGAEGWNREWAWPGGRLYPRTGTEMWGANYLKVGTVAGVKDWTDPKGNFHSYWTSGAYRTHHYDYPEEWLLDEYKMAIYPVTQYQIQRFPPPRVVVDGVDIIPDWGEEGFERVAGQIDPNLIAEKVVVSEWNYGMGVTYHRWAYGYSAPPHWDYILWDITFTNTGNVDQDKDVELPGQTLKSFSWTQTGRPKVSHLEENKGAGSNDDIGEFIEPWGPGNHLVYLTYDGDSPKTPDIDIGGAGETAYGDAYIMMSPAYVAGGAVWVDRSAGDPTDDPTQPHGSKVTQERNYDLGKQPKTMEEQYNTLFDEQRLPLNTPHPEIDPSINRPSGYLAYGPYDLGPGDDINMVYVWAASGIGWEEQYRLGKEIIERRDRGEGDMTEEEIALVQTGRDSVIAVLQHAYWNVHGVYPDGSNPKPAGRGRFDVPDAPPPPQYFSVRSSGPQIELEWSREPEEAPDFDTGVNDFAGYRIYRTEGWRDNLYSVIAEGPAEAFTDLGNGNLGYTDKDVAIGVGYFYRLVAYDDGSQNWADPGVSLESGHFYNWTGWSPKAVVPTKEPGKVLADIRVVPNPYSISGHTFAGEPDKILFKNLPGVARIRVYTTAGDLVKKIEHTDGSGDEPWDLRTDYNQYLKSGLYIFTVESMDPSVPGSHVGKFIVVR